VVRDRIRRGLSVDGLVPRAVAAYIRDRQLYQSR
jgi:nicotinic acid mononucleotide adenylyltransferase